MGKTASNCGNPRLSVLSVKAVVLLATAAPNLQQRRVKFILGSKKIFQEVAIVKLYL
jgi:hypothetical protein